MVHSVVYRNVKNFILHLKVMLKFLKNWKTRFYLSSRLWISHKMQKFEDIKRWTKDALYLCYHEWLTFISEDQNINRHEFISKLIWSERWKQHQNPDRKGDQIKFKEDLVGAMLSKCLIWCSVLTYFEKKQFQRYFLYTF